VPYSRGDDLLHTIRLVGMTYIAGKVTRPESRARPVKVRFIVDSGAVYSVLPERVWKRLGLRRRRRATFELADGTVITRGVSQCTFEIAGISGTSPVVLGGRRDAPLLGMVTLEGLGLMLNPLTRELLPMKLMLVARHKRGAARELQRAPHGGRHGVDERSWHRIQHGPCSQASRGIS